MKPRIVFSHFAQCWIVIFKHATRGRIVMGVRTHADGFALLANRYKLGLVIR